MTTLRVALAQVNMKVGDLDGNAALILARTRSAAATGAQLVVFPEMALTGYPIEDLVLRKSVVSASVRGITTLAARLAEAGCGDVAVVVGYVDQDDGGPRNAVAVLSGGRVVARQFKHHLPNHGVFDEHRYFRPGMDLTVVRLAGVDIGMVICEDLWQQGGPVTALGAVGVDLVLAVNASPYERGKRDARRALVAARATEANAPMAYVNLVGGQDELVFDGDSMIVAADGTLLARAPQFTDRTLIAELEFPAAPRLRTDLDGVRYHGFDVRFVELPGVAAPPAPDVPWTRATVSESLPDEAEVWSALVAGLRDYARKNRFRSAVLGLSGGIDSAVCAALAVDALGAHSVYGVSMPSRYSSDHSRADAAELARRTGLNYDVQPIDAMMALVDQLGLTGLAEENLQARARGVILMALSNQYGHLVLATGNKTELSVGYSTIYGDAVGGFAPIKDVPKTMVWDLARWRNNEALRYGYPAPIPERSIEKPPSAELRADQLDTDTLPPYDVLDRILDVYVEGDKGYTELLAAGFERELVGRVLDLVDRAEYKRRQFPSGTKISLKAFGRDRRMPITNRWREGMSTDTD